MDLSNKKEIILEQIGINHKPNYLDEKYEDAYEKCAKQATECLNGTTPKLYE